MPDTCQTPPLFAEQLAAMISMVLAGPNGEIDLFARGTDNALWMNVRAFGATAWQGWHRVGGYLISAPTAGMFQGARIVQALGGDGALWQGRNRVGTSTWVWTQVP